MQYESRTRCFIIHLTRWPRNLLTPAHIWLKWSGSYSRVSGRSDPAVMWVNTLVLLSFSGAMTRVEVKGCRLVDILHPSLQFERETEVKESDSSEIRRRWDVSLLCTILLIRTYLGCEVCDLLLLLFPVFSSTFMITKGENKLNTNFNSYLQFVTCSFYCFPECCWSAVWIRSNRRHSCDEVCFTSDRAEPQIS